MPTTITLKGIPDDLYARLKSAADVSHRSLNSEVIACLESVLMPRKATPAQHLAAIRAIRARLPQDGFDHAEIDALKKQGRAVIVVDTNVLAYLLIPGQYNGIRRATLAGRARVAAPLLWRSELRNVLATYVRSKRLEVSDALALHRRAADLIGAEEYNPETSDVLRLAKASGCSAYDCEFVSVAEYLDVKLVTADAKLAKAFKTRALLLSDA